MGDGADARGSSRSSSNSKEGLVTDELEDGCGNGSRSHQLKPSESVPQQSDRISDGNDARCSGVQQSHNPFEIEPGHLDFLCSDGVSYAYPRQFPSDPSTSKGDSGHSSRRNTSSTHSSSSSSSVRKLSLSQFMADWVEDTSERGTPTYDDPPATEYCSPSRIVSAPANNLPLARHRGGAQPNRPVGLQSLLANYTWAEVVAMTVDNKYKLGKGGFGSVYMGILSGKKRVAVKILDGASHQGDSEFLNEVDLLSRVNFVNLVKLLGFSQEGSKRALVYEYAEQGALWDHLHGKWFSDGTVLDWKTRLKIGLESACGLEYLHSVCTPRIIHRDIKSSNILLTKHWVAKVADFGLSKLGTDDGNQTHCSTMVKGTPGYLDPEYFRTGQLNEKSDVFSFGVVLLEMITGRAAVIQNSSNGHSAIGNWVKARWKPGRMKAVVDPKLHETYNPKVMKTVLTLALKCIEEQGRNRPDMRTVVGELRAATALEHKTVKASKWNLKSLIMM